MFPASDALEASARHRALTVLLAAAARSDGSCTQSPVCQQG